MTILYALLFLTGLGLIGYVNYRRSIRTARWLQQQYVGK